MKQLFYLLFIVTAISCSKNPVKKPERLLEEEVMVDIIYDISLLQAIEGAYPNKLIEQNIKPNQFIFVSSVLQGGKFRTEASINI